jgi:hypothetical protein
MLTSSLTLAAGLATSASAHSHSAPSGGSFLFVFLEEEISDALLVLAGADSTSATTALNQATDDNETFPRGVWQADADGLATLYFMVPGWYEGRDIYFHVKIYTNGSVAKRHVHRDGSRPPVRSPFDSFTGDLTHRPLPSSTGRFVFDNITMTAVAATDAYAANSITYADHVANEDDQVCSFNSTLTSPAEPDLTPQWYPYEEATGYDADMDITWLGQTTASPSPSPPRRRDSAREGPCAPSSRHRLALIAFPLALRRGRGQPSLSFSMDRETPSCATSSISSRATTDRRRWERLALMST